MNEILDHYLFDAFSNASDNIFIYVTDMKTDLSRWSPRAVEYFDLEGEYFYNAKDKWLEHIHPDDRQVYIDDILAVFDGTSAHHNCQYRARNRYGEYIWVECRGSLIIDSEGNPSVFAGLMTRLDNQTKYDAITHLLSGYELMTESYERLGALMMIGIDGFRNVNSQHGLMYGNKVLQYLAEVLVEQAPNTKVFRFQGDEFAVLGHDMTVQDMAAIFRKVYKICGEPNLEKQIKSFSVSAGIVEFPSNGNSVTDILSRVELSLSFAKENTSSHLAIYSTDIEEKQNRKNKVSEALIHSIKSDFAGFQLYYQPVLSNDGKRVVGCESLLRWNPNNEEIGNCYPDEFIHILEDNGGIIEVGYYVMEQSIKQAAEWQKRYKKFNVSFNVSYLQLEDPLFVPTILDTVEKYNMDTSCVIVELTESVLAADTVMVRNSFELLKKHGIKIALDDFGTGNSSFWLLHNVDIDIVKLDQSFIRGLDNSGKGIDFAIVESVGLMCDRIGCMTVAEGVETNEIWKMISKFEFSGLQGYLFSRPIPVAEFEKLLEEYNMQIDK